jgi:hypothetical protein
MVINMFFNPARCMMTVDMFFHVLVFRFPAWMFTQNHAAFIMMFTELTLLPVLLAVFPVMVALVAFAATFSVAVGLTFHAMLKTVTTIIISLGRRDTTHGQSDYANCRCHCAFHCGSPFHLYSSIAVMENYRQAWLNQT